MYTDADAVRAPLCARPSRALPLRLTPIKCSARTFQRRRVGAEKITSASAPLFRFDADVRRQLLPTFPHIASHAAVGSNQHHTQFSPTRFCAAKGSDRRRPTRLSDSSGALSPENVRHRTGGACRHFFHC